MAKFLQLVLDIFSIFAAFFITNTLTTSAPYKDITKASCEYVLPDLPYPYDGLEPYLDEATLRVHHLGHHKAYTTKLNNALKEWKDVCKEGSPSLLSLIEHLEVVPEEYRTAITNNGGGFVNHNLYWAVMSPNPSKEKRLPSGKLQEDINNAFVNFTSFQTQFTAKALTLFGSGYVWLSRQDELSGSGLIITTTKNQDSPISEGLKPILVIDVWEHAYYLKHQNKRPKHIVDWWKVINWDAVAELDSWWHTGEHAHKTDKRDEL